MDDCSKIITLSANTSWYLYNFRQSTIKRLIDKGYRVVCISPLDEYSNELKDLGCEYYDLEMQNKGTNPFKDIKTFLKLLFIYIKLKPFAAFHFTIKNNIYGTLAAFLSRTPAINNVSGLGTTFIRKNFISKVVVLLYKISQPLSYKVYCQNEDDFQLLINNKLVSKNKLFILPGSGVDIKRFNPNIVDSGNNLYTFLFVGRILADKGIRELIEAFKRLNNDQILCNLLICGFVNNDNVSSISTNEIEEWKKIHGITWINPTNKVEKVMKKADCIILPSYREGMPRSLLEAGAMGLPSIATDVPGCRNIIKDNINGLLCKPNDVISLEKSMRQIMNISEEDRLKMSKNARKIVEDSFDEEIVINELLITLDSL